PCDITYGRTVCSRFSLTPSWLFSCTGSGTHVRLLSFPTRRSSDLRGGFEPPKPIKPSMRPVARRVPQANVPSGGSLFEPASSKGDRKSTRLNSSHVKISYADFCLKKKIKLIR